MIKLIVSARTIFVSRRFSHAVVLLAIGSLLVSASPVWATEAFGLEAFESSIEGQDRSPDTQAGSHPYAVTATIMFDHEVTREEEDFKRNGKGEEIPLGEPEVFTHLYGNPRHLEINLPTGFVVNPAAATRVKCTEVQLETDPSAGGSCPNASAVGMVTAYINGFGEKVKGAVYDMVSPEGVPAELGVDAGEAGFIFHIAGKLRANDDYGFTGEVSEISQTVAIYGLKLTLWGVPSDPSHDAQRGICASRGEVQKTIEEESFEDENRNEGKSKREYRFSCPVEETGAPLLTMPGSCAGDALQTMASVESWQEPGNQIEPPPASSPAVTGCERLDFSPSLDVRPAPEAATAESPTGLNVDLKIPREESMDGLAEADLERMALTLPAGMAISPSVASGLGACTPSEIELRGSSPPSCPDSSKIGEAEVRTPVLEDPLKGAVYLAQPETFEESLVGLYLVVEGSGVAIKLGGKATLDPDTGRVTLTFEDSPQQPLSEIKLSLYGGPRAALMTPPGCGTYTTTSQLTPWSGNAPAEPSSDLTVASGCGHGFSPSLQAGTSDDQAGAFSPFSMTFSRQDGEQRLGGTRVVAPPGLLGALRDVSRCPEPQASAGECDPGSEVGEATIAVGPGEDPFWVRGGKLYLTGPYGGAPFGLSIVVPVLAGPFDLGKAIVRARVEVDSHTAQITIASDPLPSILRGIPLDVRTINLTINRPGFIFNPTDCSALSVTGTAESSAGASAAVSSPFQAVNCASLPFKPKLTVSTRARTSKAGGASLRVKIASGPGQANVAKVRAILPKQLPGRLTALQKACTAAVFDVNPASCPAASVVGTGAAVTRLLAHPLTGPAYLVSHGAGFPDLVFVLQGEGIKLYLDGNLNIKKGLTSATFNSVPDVPIDTFEIDFPEGPHSILATDLPADAKGSFCGQSLMMPTTLTGQNGARMTPMTKIAVTGCPKHKAKQAGAKKAGKKKRRLR
jgi:hypothetical protein